MAGPAIDRWYDILTYWTTVKKRTGLSFSFLVGATRDPIGSAFTDINDAKEHSHALYNELKAHPDCYAEECAVVRDLVIKLGGPTGGYFPSFETVWARFEDEITTGKFSITNGVSHPMVDCEKEWVQQAIIKT